jgi:hypothetical protein
MEVTARRSGEGGHPGHVVPNPESFAPEVSIIGGGEKMTSGAEVRSDDPVYFDEALRVPSGFESSHSSLPFSRRLM